MLRYNLALIAKQMGKVPGLDNAHALHKHSGLTVPTAYNVLRGDPLQRVEVATLETLARALNIRDALRLLEHIPDD